MIAESFEKYVSDFRNEVFDLTDKGRCKQCGSCCGNILPMTEKEIEVIRRYIKKHNIKECKHIIPLANPFLDMTCPFLNTDKKTEKCTIYSVRPAICRCFICSEPNGALKHKELWRGVRNPVNARETFYGTNNR